ncbi:MAG TPA: hypothetical protein VNL13_04910 [Sulfolobales archaeon]|nr:hypothetical protein [Sulfolobales archaeon]
MKGVPDALPTQVSGGGGSIAPSHRGHRLDGSRVPFGPTATHEPTGSLTPRVEVEAPWIYMNENKMIGTNIQGQTGYKDPVNTIQLETLAG